MSHLAKKVEEKEIKEHNSLFLGQISKDDIVKPSLKNKYIFIYIYINIYVY